MASSRSAPAFVILAVLALASGAASQAPAASPAAGPDCGAALSSLTGCLTYIAPGSTQGKPPKECCAGVKAAVANPASVSCLCDAFHTNYGIPINLTRAGGLPAACGENPAAFSKCNIKLPGAPSEAPSPTSGSTPGTVSPGPSKSAATRSPVSAATLVLTAVAAPLLSYYYL